MDKKTIDDYFSAYFDRFGASLPFSGEDIGIREAAKAAFLKEGMPDVSREAWRKFPWERIMHASYRMLPPSETYHPVDAYFQCNTQEINAEMFPFLNGWYQHSNAPLTRFPNGLVVGSLREAVRQYPDKTLPYLRQLPSFSNGMISFNAALWQDGFFVYVPDGVKVHHPIQLVNMVKADEDILIQPRHLVILGEGASLKLVHCDESLQCKEAFINTVTEIRVGASARFDYYKLENNDNRAAMVNHLLIRQEAHSEVNTHTTIFNGGLVHNTIRVDLDGPFAKVNNNGLYLTDGKQHVSNFVSVCHHSTDGTSNQLYKGILDDEAYASFIGHVLVEPHAQRTEAHQINRNILLKDSARISAKPFLEIYADDVQCTHGATVGQLDEEAVFYLRSRGICERNARVLLMHAYAKEVIGKMDIPALCERTENLVSKRLSGETIQCGDCMQCNKKIDFQVDFPEC